MWMELPLLALSVWKMAMGLLSMQPRYAWDREAACDSRMCKRLLQFT